VSACISLCLAFAGRRQSCRKSREEEGRSSILRPDSSSLSTTNDLFELMNSSIHCGRALLKVPWRSKLPRSSKESASNSFDSHLATSSPPASSPFYLFPSPPSSSHPRVEPTDVHCPLLDSPDTGMCTIVRLSLYLSRPLPNPSLRAHLPSLPPFLPKPSIFRQTNQKPMGSRRSSHACSHSRMFSRYAFSSRPPGSSHK